jgi:hypothetical protein
MVPEYEAHFMELLGMLRTLTLRNLRSTGSCSALTTAYVQRLGF